jgi:hypothetical protein
MREVDYKASISDIKRGGDELQSLVSRVEHITDRFIQGYKATSGWQGSGDSLADSLTHALEREYKEILDSCYGIRDVIASLADATGKQGRDVETPSIDAQDKINEARVRY